MGKSAYKLSAAVVLCYKAIELDDPIFLSEAKMISSQALALVPNCNVDWHPRRNSEHLSVSLLCASYHVALAEKDEASFLKALHGIEESVGSISNFFTPSYPIGLGILLLILVKAKEGDTEEIERLVSVLENVFRFAVRDSSIDKLTLFMELEVTHKSLVLAKKVSRGEVSLGDAFNHTVRVKGVKAQQLFQNFNEMFSGELST